MRAEAKHQLLSVSRRAAESSEAKQEPRLKERKGKVKAAGAAGGKSGELQRAKSCKLQADGGRRKLAFAPPPPPLRKLQPATKSTRHIWNSNSSLNSEESISTSRSSSSGEKHVPVRVTSMRATPKRRSAESADSMEAAPPSPVQEPPTQPRKWGVRLMTPQTTEKAIKSNDETNSRLTKFLGKARSENKTRNTEAPPSLPSMNPAEQEMVHSRLPKSAPGGSLVTRKKIKSSFVAPPPWKLWQSAPAVLSESESPGEEDDRTSERGGVAPKPTGWVQRLKKKVTGR